MDLGALLFTMFLVGLGVLLILLVRQGMMERALFEERRKSIAARPPRRPASRAALRPDTMGPLRKQATAWESLSDSSVRAAFEKFLPDDPWRGINASSVNDAFEEFMRKM